MRRDQIAPLIVSLLGDLTRFARLLAGTTHEGDDIVQETLSGP